MELFNSFLPKFQHIGLWGYWVLLFISMGEATPLLGLLIPGTVFLMLFGFFSAQGYLDIGDLIWFAAIGAIMGDALSFYMGQKGTQLFHHENKILKLSHLDRGRHFFEAYGSISVF